eukprot:gene2881-1863_t
MLSDELVGLFYFNGDLCVCWVGVMAYDFVGLMMRLLVLLAFIGVVLQCWCVTFICGNIVELSGCLSVGGLCVHIMYSVVNYNVWVCWMCSSVEVFVFVFSCIVLLTFVVCNYRLDVGILHWLAVDHAMSIRVWLCLCLFAHYGLLRDAGSAVRVRMDTVVCFDLIKDVNASVLYVLSCDLILCGYCAI